jgi:A/G-specific adenine glycosylase
VVAGALADFQRLLLAWYRRTARPLPWRATRDPYAILVSEIMLQQTQVARVEPAWRAFLARFPTAAALARAPLAEVLTQWRGLGYNRRARDLQRAAAAVVAEHGGEVPADLDALLALPGIGPYTARAVLAFAHERDVAPVDTNVARVLARAVAGAPLGRAALQRLADDVVPSGDGDPWSQALMDLGARVCLARVPRCDDCPVAAACAWRRAGGPDPAAGTALRSRPQATFAGSARYHRGRLLDALREAPVPRAALAGAAALADDPARAGAIADGLVRDELAQWDDELLRLPG